MIRKILIALAITLVPVVRAEALTLSPGSYAGQIHEGYTFNDGYWWRDGNPYLRYQAYQVYYDPSRCCNYTRTLYSYQAAPYQKKAETIYPDRDPEWKTKLLAIAADRDKVEAQLRKSAQYHNEFLESVKSLGLDGNFRWDGYGYAPIFPQGYRSGRGYGYGLKNVDDGYGAVLGHLSTAYSQVPSSQGATVYGYRESADLYGNIDLGGVYREALRLRGDSRALEAEGDKGTTALVDKLGERAAGVAEIKAKGEAVDRAITAASRALSSISAEKRVQMIREVYGSGTTTSTGGSGSSEGVSKTAEISRNTDFVSVATEVTKKKCLSCHSAEKKNGGLDMTNLTLLSNEQVTSILKRIVSSDPLKRMPLAGDLKPGTPLTETEIAAFYLAAYADSKK